MLKYEMLIAPLFTACKQKNTDITLIAKIVTWSEMKNKDY